MPNQNIRSVIAAAVLLRDLPDDDAGQRVVIDTGVDAMPLDLRGELVHAERENVEKAAHEIDVRAGYAMRLGSACVLRAERETAQRQCRGEQATRYFGRYFDNEITVARLCTRHHTTPRYATQHWRGL